MEATPRSSTARLVLVAIAAVGLAGLALVASPAGAEEPAPSAALDHDPTHAPDSDFVRTEWGYVREDFQAPDDPLAPVLMVDGYTGASTPESASPDVDDISSPTHYVEMRDGTLIAVHIHTDFPLLPDGYTLAWASIRGTGCSGGTFDLFDRTHAWDGYELIEWLSERDWTREDVGLFGASYSGITALHIASTQPPSLAAMSSNMVLGDLYRDIVRPGGVLNQIFPAVWTTAYRPMADYLGTYGGAQAADDVCLRNVATRGQASPLDHPLLVYTRDTDDTWYQVRSPSTYAENIDVPTYISQAWQDEQTGPRAGTEVFNAIEPDPVTHPASGETITPKYLRATNGVHSTALALALQDAEQWFDHWLLGEANGVLDEAPVELHLQAERTAQDAIDADAVVELDEFPVLDEEAWTKLYLREGGQLTEQPPAPDEGASAYVTGSPRQGWSYEDPSFGTQATMADGPDTLVFRTAPAEETKLVAGPTAAKLAVTTSAPDTDLFVYVFDVDTETGDKQLLQRGMQRASHQTLDEHRTLYNEAGDVVRPYHGHTDTSPVTPGEVDTYHVEVFPLAHVLHEDHALEVHVTTPPLLDGIWGYDPVRSPGVNLVHHEAANPSHLTMPIQDWPAHLEAPPEPACGQPTGYWCIPS